MDLIKNIESWLYNLKINGELINYKINDCTIDKETLIVSMEIQPVRPVDYIKIDLPFISEVDEQGSRGTK